MRVRQTWIALLLLGFVGGVQGGDWQFLGPEAAAINGMTDPSRETLVVSTAFAHVFRSDDGGESWEPTLTGLPTGIDLSFGRIVNDARNPQELFIASGHRTQDDNPVGNLLRSVDGGRTWIETDAGLMSGTPVNIVSGIDTEGGTDLYVTVSLCPDWPFPCFLQTFLSRDQGGSWNELRNAPVNGFVIAAADDAAYIAVDQRLFRTVDRGETWQEIDDGIGDCALTALTVDRYDPFTLYAATAEEGARFVCGDVYRSTDGGGHWTATGLSNDARSVASRSMQVLVGARMPGFFYPRGGVAESFDGGLTWIDLDAPVSNVSQVEFGPRGFSAYAASDQGLYRLPLVSLPSIRIEPPARVSPRLVTPP